MKHYLDAGNRDRVYSEQGDCFNLLNEDFDYEKASARMLGCDVGRLLTENSQPILERVLSEASDKEGARGLTATMVWNNANYHGDFELALSMLAQLRIGISERVQG